MAYRDHQTLPDNFNSRVDSSQQPQPEQMQATGEQAQPSDANKQGNAASRGSRTNRVTPIDAPEHGIVPRAAVEKKAL